VDDVGEERVREAADAILAVARRSRDRVVVRPVVGGLGLGGGEGEALVVGVGLDLWGGDVGRGEEGDEEGDDAVDTLLRGRALQGVEEPRDLIGRGELDAFFASGVPGGAGRRAARVRVLAFRR
jgi:hypothetical protein